MSAAFSWVNRCRSDIDGLSAIVQNMTSAVFDSAYPAQNILDPDPTKLSRINFVNSTGATRNVGFESTFSAVNVNCRLLAAINFRLPANVATVTLGAQTTLGGSVFSVVVNAADLVPQPGTTDVFNLFYLHTSAGAAARAQFTAQIPTGSTDYISGGHIWCGDAFVPTDGVDADWSIGTVDPEPGSETFMSGTPVGYILPKRAELQTSISAREYNEIMGTPQNPAAPSWRQFIREAGMSTPLIALPRVGSTTQDIHASQIIGMYCKAIALPTIGHQGGNFFASGALTLRQIV